MKTESILLAASHIDSYKNSKILSSASGFYFHRGEQLFLITNRHVVCDENSGHFPDELKLLIHTDPENLAETSLFCLPLYDLTGTKLWKEATDTGGTVDVVALLLDKELFSKTAVYTAFSEENLPRNPEEIEIGESIRVIGFPLDFQDQLHGLPVMRHAIISSSYSLRFQGNGYFLTDSLLHRGSSGSPVIMRIKSDPKSMPGNEDRQETYPRVSGRDHFPWVLLGVHSARMNASNRDENEDERLNLFAAWYSDILLTLTN